MPELKKEQLGRYLTSLMGEPVRLLDVVLLERVPEKDGGVYIEVEAVALSRSVPWIFAWLVNPLLQSIPKGVLSDLLIDPRRAVLNCQI